VPLGGLNTALCLLICQNKAMFVARLVGLTAMSAALIGMASAQGMAYSKTWNAAKAQAARQNKLVMLDFWTTWCGYCKQMSATTLKDRSVVQKSKALIPLRLNAEAEGRSLAQKYGISSYPAFIFVDSSGSVFGRLQGAASPAAFNRAMDQAINRFRDFTTLTAQAKRNPKNGAAFAGLAAINGSRGLVDTAEAQAKRAESLGYKGSKLAEAWVAIGEGARNKKRAAGAIAYYQKSLKYPGTPKDVSYAHYAIAALSAQLERRADALKHVRLALNTKGAPKDVVSAARELLAFLNQ
jgi:thiol-disulfide isomerase/thioredoxin